MSDNKKKTDLYGKFFPVLDAVIKPAGQEKNFKKPRKSGEGKTKRKDTANRKEQI